MLPVVLQRISDQYSFFPDTEEFNREGVVQSVRDSIIGQDHIIGGPYGPKKVCLDNPPMLSWRFAQTIPA